MNPTRARVVLGALMVVLLGPLGLPAAAQGQDDRIHLINGIPDSTVDVFIGDELAVPDFAFRDTQDLTDRGGQSLADVVIREAGSDEVLLDAGTIELPASGNATVILHLKVDGSPSVSIFDNDISQLEPGQSRLVVRHLAAAPPVDVVSAGQVLFEGLANGAEVAADLDPGSVPAALVPTGEDGPNIVGPADLPLLEGVSLIVYGLGSLERDTMTVLTESITGLDGAPNAVNTGNSPVDGAIPLVVGMVALAGSLALLGATSLSSLRGPERS